MFVLIVDDIAKLHKGLISIAADCEVSFATDNLGDGLIVVIPFQAVAPIRMTKFSYFRALAAQKSQVAPCFAVNEANGCK